MSFIISSTLSENLFKSYTPIPLFPLSTTAFNFFEPITAPIPVLPAALLKLFIIPEIFTKFSPA